MSRWEYLTLESSKNYGTTKFFINGDMQPSLKNAVLANVMNQIGSEGWEMVGIASDGDGHKYIFKRATTKAYQAAKDKPPA